jgi:hypothetical protein
MTKVSNQVATFVRRRADNRCEYCQSHQDLMMSKLQIDHILPVAKGGSNDEANLSLACDMCNGYKWQKVGGVDPISGIFVTIFNPRQQQWPEHFEWSEDGDEVIGLTPCGRVTVSELKMNNSIAVTVRRHWVQAGWHPPQE